MAEFPPLLPRAPHGGPTAQPLGGLDFSVNANPYGPNPRLKRAAAQADHAHYPDPAYQAVKETLAAWHRVSSDEVALSVGASDLLHRLVRALVPVGGQIISVHAPFGELARAAQLQRAEVQVVRQPPAQLSRKVQLVYVGHPHNPTGHHYPASELLNLAKACALVGAALIIDEAYAPFVLNMPVIQHPAAVRLLSPGKVHGLVGARPAYALGSAEVVAKLENLAPAWHLPASTAAVLSALPRAQGFLQRTLPQLRRDAAALASGLRAFGEVEHHHTPFMLLRVSHAPTAAAALLGRGVRVRDCASYGLPHTLRLSTRTPIDNAYLLRVLSELRATGERLDA